MPTLHSRDPMECSGPVPLQPVRKKSQSQGPNSKNSPWAFVLQSLKVSTKGKQGWVTAGVSCRPWGCRDKGRTRSHPDSKARLYDGRLGGGGSLGGAGPVKKGQALPETPGTAQSGQESLWQAFTSQPPDPSQCPPVTGATRSQFPGGNVPREWVS